MIELLTGLKLIKKYNWQGGRQYWIIEPPAGSAAGVLRKDRAMRKSFDVYSDPGHGWVKVPFQTIVELGLIDEITCFSYQRGGFAYLEEDCDMSALLIALKARGITPKFREHNCRERRSKIRGYTCYTPAVVRNWLKLSAEAKAIEKNNLQGGRE